MVVYILRLHIELIHWSMLNMFLVLLLTDAHEHCQRLASILHSLDGVPLPVKQTSVETLQV